MRIICHGLKTEDFSVEFLNHEISLGYAESNLISVKAEGVSRHHAILLEDGDSLFIKDNGSLNGTYLNRREIHGRQRLFSGDTIQIGIQHIMVEISSDRTITLNFIPPNPGKDAAGRSGEKKPEEATGKKPGSAAESSEAQRPSSRTESMFVEGREIGKYIIGKRIGKGGMGEIYLAKHKTLGIYRALKVLPTDIREDNAEFFERFILEAKLASEIRHHNVVGVMDVETDPSLGFPYIVMEYVDGGSLRNSLNSNKRLSEEQAIVIVEAVASALRAAEAHKIVHRDIKPDNIMFTQQGEVKLADLGIAKNGDIDNDLTRTNTIIGTPAYLPPEQAQNAKHVDCRADIYSLGATFYEMLTGELPYPGNNTFEIIHKLVTDPVPDPRDINPEISAASASIVMKMLAKDPKDRFQNAGELLELMDRTFPPHTAYETAELIKKVLAGECENSAAFSSEITMPQTEKWIGRFSKRVGLFFVGFCCFFSAFFFCTNIRPFDTRLPSTPQNTEEKHTAVDEPAAEVGTTRTTGESQLAEAAGTPRTTDESQPAEAAGTPRTTGESQTGETTVVLKDPDEAQIPADSDTSSAPAVSEQQPERLPDPVKRHKLQVRTVPDSTVHLTFPDGSTVPYSSDQNGVLTISDLEAGKYEIGIERKNYRPTSQVFDLDSDTVLELPIAPDLKRLIVSAQPGSEIQFYGRENKKRITKASEYGVAVFEDLLADENATLHVELQGWEPYDRSFELVRDTQEVTVTQTRIRVSLTVRTTESAKLVLKQDGKEVQTTEANSNGEATFDGISSGEYSLNISCEGYHSRKMPVNLSRNMDLDAKLQLITYKLRIRSNPGAVIKLYLNLKSLGEGLRVPSTGLLELPEMLPGHYMIDVKKDGMIGDSFQIKLNEDTEVDCRLTEPEKNTNTKKSGSQAKPQSQSAVPTNQEKKLESAVRVFFAADADSALADYIRNNGVEIRIGDRTWSDIEFPWKQIVDPGEYEIIIRSRGIKDFSSKFTLSTGGLKEFAFDPNPRPASLVFDSNQADAVIKFNEKSYKPGDEVACESFQSLSATAEYGGKRITQTIRGGMKPETRQTMMFTFAENNDSSSQERYSEGLELFRQKRYDDALETLLPIAEENMDAARKVAEIYELKQKSFLNVFGFSDSLSADALTWYKKAADLGDPESALKVADDIFNKGEFKVREGYSVKLMVQYYKMAAAAELPGKAEIYYRLSVIYRDGYKTDFKADDAQAVKYLEEAAKLGQRDAMYELGERYDKGHGIVANNREAVKWIRKAADAGHPKAKRYIGNLKQ